MFERYTEAARRALFFARYEASQLGSISIEPEHLLLGLLRDPVDSDLVPTLTVTMVRQQLFDEASRHEPASTSVEIPFAKRTKSALETAAREADALQHGHIGTEHLLLALAVTPGTDRVLEAQGIGADALRRLIAQRPPPPGGPVPPITPADARAVTAEARRYATLGQLAAAVAVVRAIAEQHANVPGVQELAYRACHELEALKAVIAEA